MSYLITATASGTATYPSGIPFPDLGIDPITGSFSDLDLGAAYGLSQDEIGKSKNVIARITAGHITAKINGIFVDSNNVGDVGDVGHIHLNKPQLDRITNITGTVNASATDTITTIEETDIPTGTLMFYITDTNTNLSAVHVLAICYTNGDIKYTQTSAGDDLDISISVTKNGTTFEFDVTNNGANNVDVTVRQILI